MKIPKTNVRMVDVICTVGEISGGKLVNNLAALCTSNKINMWAKYKPVAYNFTYDRPDNWWKAGDGYCGLVIPSIGSDFSIIDTAEWGYTKPHGGSTSPYRIDDFAGYDPEAKPLVLSGYNGTVEANRADTGTFKLYPYYGIGLSDGNLGYDDIVLGGKALGDCYVAVQIYYNGFSVYACANNTIRNYGYIPLDLSVFSSSQMNVNMTLRFFIVGTYFAQKTSWTAQDIQYCMHQTDDYPASLTFKVKEVEQFVVLVTKISPTLSGFTPISNYSNPSTPLQLSTSSTMYAYCKATNRTSAPYQLSLSNMSGASLQFGNTYKQKSFVAFYDTSYQQISTITIPSNQSVDFIVRWKYYDGNSAPSSEEVINGKLNFLYLQNSIYIDVTADAGPYYVKSAL